MENLPSLHKKVKDQ